MTAGGEQAAAGLNPCCGGRYSCADTQTLSSCCAVAFCVTALGTGVGQSLTQSPSLQAEQQLVDCAQAFNNHGCSG